MQTKNTKSTYIPVRKLLTVAEAIDMPISIIKLPDCNKNELNILEFELN